MATGTVYVDISLKDRERGVSVVAGRMLLGNNALVRPQDLNLRTIRSINLQPWYATTLTPAAAQLRSAMIAAGSIGSLGVLDTSTSPGTMTGNYVRVRNHRFYGSVSASAHGTWRLGTQPGSVRLSFLAVGQ